MSHLGKTKRKGRKIFIVKHIIAKVSEVSGREILWV
jgi:hypothetical protein